MTPVQDKAFNRMMKEKESNRKEKQMDNEFAQKSKQIRNNFKHKSKETENNFELAKMERVEKTETRKAAAQEKQNQHHCEMAKLAFEEKKLDLIKIAINHSAVKNETIIPGMIFRISYFLCIKKHIL